MASGTPNSDTRSVATALPRRFDQRGSEYVRVTRSPAAASTHAGSTPATVRAHSREVSTSSAAMTIVGGRFATVEPGQIANRAPREPSYSMSARRRGFPVFGSFGGSCARPIWESSPVSRAWWTRSARSLVSSAPGSLRVSPSSSPSWRICAARSCHSRMRRKLRNSAPQRLRN